MEYLIVGLVFFTAIWCTLWWKKNSPETLGVYIVYEIPVLIIAIAILFVV